MTKLSELVYLMEPLIKPIRFFESKAASTKTQKKQFQNRFGGQPFLNVNEEWPECSSCRQALDFICQFDGSQVIQVDSNKNFWFSFFYCWDCFPWGDKSNQGQWKVFYNSNPSMDTVQWLINPEQQSIVTKPTEGEIWEGQSAPAWASLGLYCPEVVSSLKEEYRWDELDALSGFDAELEAKFDYQNWVKEIGSTKHEATTFVDSEMTFVGGYPQWLQEDCDETPNCSDCNQKMSLLAQVASDDSAEIMWADGGTVYLFYCPVHLDKVALRLHCH